MKRTIFSFILLFAVAVPMLMADAICDDLMVEGKQKYNAGQYEKAKSLFQTVIEQCGYNSAREWLAKCNDALAPTTLSVSRTNVLVDASTDSITNKKSTPTAAQLAQMNATINKVWVDHNVLLENNQTGMRIHVDFNVENMKGFDGNVIAWFYDAQTGNTFKQSNNLVITPPYDNSRYSDYTFFIPNDFFREEQTKKNLKFQVCIYALENIIGRSQFEYFTYAPNAKLTTPTPTAAQLAQMEAKINKVWVDYDAVFNNENGVLLHVDYDAYNMKDFRIQLAAWFYDSNGKPLKCSDSNEQLMTGSHFIEDEQSIRYPDYLFFIPHDKFCKNGNLKFRFSISEATSEKVLASHTYNFSTNEFNNNSRKTFLVYGANSSATFTMVRVKGGSFVQNGGIFNDERSHSTIKNVDDFWIAETEVTQQLWLAVMGNNPSYHRFGGNYPVEQVSYDDCLEFIRRLNEIVGGNFRLPTDAEWEYAARGGRKHQGYKYAGSKKIKGVAWYSGNSNGMTHPVAQKQPNELGLYDMCGNVAEYCKEAFYDSLFGDKHVLRGGNRFDRGKDCKVVSRSYDYGLFRWADGLRLAM